MKKTPIIFVALAVLIAGLTGCASQSQSETAEGWPEKLTVAYLPTESTDVLMESRNGMQEDLAAYLGIEVEEVPCTDYNAVIEAMRTGRADAASFGPFSFVLASERADVEAIAMHAPNGDKLQAVYQSLFITNVDNTDINSITDIKGCTFAFVDPNSTSGNLVPSGEIILAFPDLNLTVDDVHTNGTFFSATSFSGTHPAGAAAVEKNDVDVAPIASTTFYRLIEQGELDESWVKVIHTSPDIPNSPWAVRSDLPDDLKEKLQEFLLSYENETYFENAYGNPDVRFVEASLSDFEPVMELAKIIGE